MKLNRKAVLNLTMLLARKKQDGKFYALKQIKKGALNEREIQRLLDERDIMLMGRETGSIQLYSTFQTVILLILQL